MKRSFCHDRRGNVLPIFAIMAIPMIASTGAVVDYTNAFHRQTLVQDALDAAALAGNKVLGVLPDREVELAAKNTFEANTTDKVVSGLPLNVVVGQGYVEARTTLHVPTYFLGMIGIREFVYDLKARSIAGAATYEVVMVLDNSGSMAGSKISSLRSAARDLTRVLFEVNQSNPKRDPVKIGLVPFSAAVNIGPDNEMQSWMDRNAAAPYANENFDTRISRFDLFDDIRNVSWQGCVEARPHPYDVTDDQPDPTRPATLFEPMFAPDEPDTSYAYANSYIDDLGGACETPLICPRNWSKKKCDRRGGVFSYDPSDADRQAFTCKYDRVSLTGSHNNGVDYGPNYNCTAKPLQALTTNRGQIESVIAQMDANGLTNIHAGIVWGWRLLSPGAPFSEGRSYGTEGNRKIMIVMTDGENTYTTNNTQNKSTYGAFGYIAKGHLDTTNTYEVIDRMNDRTLEACANAKAAGDIQIYTVAFQVRDRSTLEMLERCASRAEMAFRSDSNSDLIETFQQIAQEISLLRLES